MSFALTHREKTVPHRDTSGKTGAQQFAETDPTRPIIDLAELEAQLTDLQNRLGELFHRGVPFEADDEAIQKHTDEVEELLDRSEELRERIKLMKRRQGKSQITK